MTGVQTCALPILKESGIIGKLLYKLQTPMIKFIIKQSSRIIVPNEYEREIFGQFSAKTKTTIVRNGVNLDQYLVNLSDFKSKYRINGDFVLFVGRFAKVKGVDILLKAWSEIEEQVRQKNLKLVIMGVDFGFESQMMKMIHDLRLSDIVLVIKNPTRSDVLAAYSSCIFLALPSRWELSPLTPLEGFAFKKTIVSTTAHGIPFTITNGENSILVSPENHIELSKALLKLQGHTVMREALGYAGYKLVQEICNATKMTEKTLEIYRDILNR